MISVIVILLGLWTLAGCTGSSELTEADPIQNGKPEAAEQLNDEATDELEAETEEVMSLAEQERLAELHRKTRQLEAELFDQFYEKYAGLYNDMINEYMTAQTHLQVGDLERAKTSAVRAATILPSEVTYELVVVIMSLLEDEAGLEEWRGRLQELREVKESGGFINAEGEIIFTGLRPGAEL